MLLGAAWGFVYASFFDRTAADFKDLIFMNFLITDRYSTNSWFFRAEMVSESSSGHEDNKKGNTSKKRRRGAYILKTIDKLTKVGRIPMRWNTSGQPNGEHTSLFQAFIGFHVRARVSISIPNWKAVPDEVKVLIFEAVKVAMH